MKRLLIVLAVLILGGCATTEYKVFEGKGSEIEGKGGTKVIVEL